MTSYLRMQAAAAAPAPAVPVSPGREGQNAGKKDGQYIGHEQGQLKRQRKGQVKRQVDGQAEGPDTSTYYREKATACSVEVQSVQVSGYSYMPSQSVPMAVDSEMLRGAQSQAASKYHSAKVSHLLFRNWLTRPNHDLCNNWGAGGEGWHTKTGIIPLVPSA